MSSFNVDTHLFRELGELLVGRDSTALIELVKNAYDADATRVIVTGFGLEDANSGYITIEDDGTGMTPTQFAKGFLTIAARGKEEGERRSAKFGRKFTGAKGVGRLAAHKLARLLELTSIPTVPDAIPLGVKAQIDWDAVETKELISELGPSEVRIEAQPIAPPFVGGTTIQLRRLRRPWTPEERQKFMLEVQSFQPPVVLIDELSSAVLGTPSLLGRVALRDVRSKQDEWRVELHGAFEGGDELWQNEAASAHWVIEILADGAGKSVSCQISPTPKRLKSDPGLKPLRVSLTQPKKAMGFSARIFVKEGQAWNASTRGIRVYMEGFRVLPYGEVGDDWLGIDELLASRRTGKLDLSEHLLKASDKEALSVIPNRQYFGAVFLTQEQSPGLRMLVNREGFIRNEAFLSIKEVIQEAVNLSVRVRAAASSGRREERARTRRADRADEQKSEFLAAGEEVTLLVKSLAEQTTAARAALARNDLEAASRALEGLGEIAGRLEEAEGASLTASAMVRILASVGMHLAGFVHEIRSLLSTTESLERTLRKVRAEAKLNAGDRRQVAEVLSLAGDLRRSLERHAAYLIDVLSPDARRRRLRLVLAERLDSAIKLLEPAAEAREVSVQRSIPASMKSPPMFPAELTMVFTNLLTNAIKAAGKGGTIKVGASREGSNRLSVTVENSGTAVNLDEAERWFLPFESTTTKVDPLLGQGMGMGLPITRAILEEYGGTIQFVPPTAGFATCVKFTLPG